MWDTHDVKQLTNDPEGKTFRLPEVEHGLERILEGEVQGLGGKVAKNVCAVSAPH